MKAVECINLSGRIIPVPAGALVFRPAAYAILIRDRKILLLKMKATGKYHLPGGGVEVGDLKPEHLQHSGEKVLAICNRGMDDFPLVR